LNGTADDIWPTHLTFDPNNEETFCTSFDATMYGVYPSGGFNALWSHYHQVNVTSSLNYVTIHLTSFLYLGPHTTSTSLAPDFKFPCKQPLETATMIAAHSLCTWSNRMLQVSYSSNSSPLTGETFKKNFRAALVILHAITISVILIQGVTLSPVRDSIRLSSTEHLGQCYSARLFSASISRHAD